MIRCLILSLILVNLLCVSCLACSSKHIAIVGSPVYSDMLHRIESALFSEPTPRPDITRIDPLSPDSLAQLQQIQFDLIISLGLNSTEQILKITKNEPIFALLVPKNDFIKVQQKYGHRLLTAIFLDHPIGRQLNLIQHIMLPSDQHLPLTVILGPTSFVDHDILQKEALERNLRLKVIQVGDTANPIHNIDLALTNSSFLFILPDAYLFNANTAQGILLSTFRKKVPLIAYTKNYVIKGAIAAIYSTPEQIAKEAALFILEIIQKSPHQAFAARFPKTFSVTINTQVARSLGRFIDNVPAIQYALEEKERSSPEGYYCSLPKKNVQ